VDPTKLYAGSTIGGLIITALNRYPERTAFIGGTGEFTYDEVAAHISRAIQLLQSLGLQKGEAVVQLSRNKPEQWFIAAACYIAGYRSVTLHALGSTPDQAFTINDSEAAVAIFDAYFSAKVEELQIVCPAVRHWRSHDDVAGSESFWSAAARFEAAALVDETEAEDIIRLAYTGGTTGRAKGVLLSSRSILYQAMLSMIDRDWPERPIFLCPAPISHGAGGSVVPTLARGGTFILMPRFDVREVLDAVPRHRANMLHTVPTMIYALLDHPDTRSADLSSLQAINYGASPISPTRLQEALRTFGPILCQTYGQTETPSSITILRKADHLVDDLDRLGSCGLPYSGIQVELLDAECKAVAPGAVGEICVRGPIVMSGYWKLPEQTEEAFRGDWLHTGDLAYRDGRGYFHIVDRMKDMIISGGFNVYPKEIETVLESDPGVSAAVVIGLPDDKWGEAVTAVIVARDPAPSAERLIALVRDAKGAVAAPKSIIFVDAFPLTPVGKPDKSEMKKRLAARRADQSVGV
jgi:fatty-acyl-CoA synthase